MSQSFRVASSASLLRCHRCGNAFVEMLALIGHGCPTDPRAMPPTRPPRTRRPEASGGGKGATR